MGSIRTKDIKKAAHELTENYADRFSSDFENNKVVLTEMDIVGTKIVRNKVAGYITRLMKRHSK